jgi:hypothetical protein
MLKFITVMLIIVSVTNGQEQFLDKNEKRVSRLYTIAWFPVEHRLKFTIENGECAHAIRYDTDKCLPKDVTITSKNDWSIDIDNAEMYAVVDGKEVKPLSFSINEATNVHKMLDIFERYGLDSHVWYRMGGDRVVNPAIKVRREVPPRVGVFEKQIKKGFLKVSVQ